MPEPGEGREHPSTYMIQDRSILEELTRQDIQDRMLTAGMGGVLPELADPASLRRVLDVGCGTGGWLMEMAKAYPTIERLVGADISCKVVTYAREQAIAQRLDGRVQFQTMDALRILEFPQASFDLVNQRLAVSWLRTWEWTKILLEYQRVTRPGGIIRIVDAKIIESNSPAFTKLNNILLEVFYNSGRFFELSRDGVTSELVPLMTRHGIEDVQSRAYKLVYRAGTESGQQFYDDVVVAYRLFLPFMGKWTRVPSDYEKIYQQAMHEIKEPGSVATWTFVTAWGTRPNDEGRLFMRGLR